MRLIFICFFIACSHFSQAQGCSDAGFCTMGAMRPNQAYNKRLKLKLRSVEYNFYRGTTTTSPVIFAHTFEFNASLGNKIALQAKVPYMYISGNLGENQGIGDVSISATRNIINRSEWSVNGTLGGKIPTNKSNASASNNHSLNQSVNLPMYYQTSLGSYDLVGGLSWINDKWLLATGIQMALTENQNVFQWGDWAGYGDQKYIQRHDVGRNLHRGTDIMFRAERNFRFTNFDFSLGILPIYRLTKDEVYIPNLDQRIKLEGTTGLALSELSSFGYSFDINHGVRFIFGLKITDRKINPDGLTRNDVLSVSYIYRF